MITDITYFIWTSGVIMNAVFTILFFILIRFWTRGCTNSKMIEDLANSQKERIKENLKEIETVENFTVNDNFDFLFYCELFTASIIAGFLTRYGW